MISIIAAIGANRELGKDNKLLWKNPEDMKRFRELTAGHPVIMGRTTFQSIGKPLANRTNIIITRDENFQASGCLVAHSLLEAINRAKEIYKNEIFIIGGGQIYAQAIDIADKLYLTVIEGTFDADTFFPDYSRFKKVVFRQDGQTDNLKYTFLELVP
jgi:dihydrofolate reductase